MISWRATVRQSQFGAGGGQAQCRLAKLKCGLGALWHITADSSRAGAEPDRSRRHLFRCRGSDFAHAALRVPAVGGGG